MMKQVYFFLMVLFAFGSVQAGAFQFAKDQCAVNSTDNTLKFSIDDKSFNSRVDVSLFFSSEPAVLPKIRVIFREHYPSGAVISWRPIESSRRGLALFRSELLQRIQLEEGQPFELVRVGEDQGAPVFETPFLTLERSQDMVALFLSQNEMEVRVPSPEGPLWTAKLSLQNSDASFRALAQNCFAEKAVNYLKSTGERTSLETPKGYSNASIHWSEGYGLTAFTFIKAQLPPALQNVAWPTETEDAYLQVASEVLRLVELKLKTSESLESALNDPDYVALEENLSLQYAHLESLYSRFTSLTTPTSGAIAQKSSHRDQLMAQIAQVEAQIQNLQHTESGQAQEVAAAATALEPFLAQLNSYVTALTAHNGRLDEIKISLETLAVLLQEDQAILAGRDFGSVAVSPEGPWSVEEIEQRQKANRELDQKIQTVVLLKQLLESLVGELALLVQKAQEHEAAFVAYNQLVGQEVALKRQITAVDQWMQSQQKVPALGSMAEAQFATLNAEAEHHVLTDLGDRPRDYNAEFAHYESYYRTLEAQFATQKSEATEAAPVLSHLLCLPNVLMNPLNRKSNCLTPEEMQDDKLVEAFFEAMPPVQKDELLALVQKQKSTGEIKSQILLSEFMRQRASAEPHVRAPFETWMRIRHNIWRWATMQKEAAALDICGTEKPADPLPGGLYAAAYYEKAFQCEMTHKNNQWALRDQALAALAPLQPSLEQAKQQRDIIDQEFSRLSAEFVNMSMQKLSQVGEQGDLTRLFTECVLPLRAAEACSQSLSGAVVSSQGAIDQQSAIYLDTVRALILNMNARMALLNEEHAGVAAEIERIRAEESAYMVQNNIEALKSQKAQLEQQLSSTQAAIVQLQEANAKSNAILTTANQNLATLEQEASALTAQLHQAVSEIRTVLPSYEPHCAQIRPGVSQLQELDKALYGVLAPGETIPEVSTVYSSCQMKELEHYLPSAVTREISIPERIP